MKVLEITDSRIQESIKLYKLGKTLTYIAKELKVDRNILSKFFKELNILRNRSEDIRKGKSLKQIKDDAFDIFTPETLYWIGFLYADGHIEKDRPRITITLANKDLLHVQKFADFINCNVRKVKGGYRACFSSKKIYQRLLDLGFTNRKTWDLTPHDSLKYSRDFWRGVIDGDGWIFNTKQISIGLCGHNNTIKEFISFVKFSGIETKATSCKVKKREYLWQCDLHSKKALDIAKILYKDSQVYLDRKYEIYKTHFC